MTVQRNVPTFTFEERVRAADTMYALHSGSKAAEEYFDTVLLPKILPDQFSPNDVPGVTRINARTNASLELDKATVGKHFMELVSLGEMSEEDAYLCADMLDIPLQLQDADVIYLHPRVPSQGALPEASTQ